MSAAAPVTTVSTSAASATPYVFTLDVAKTAATGYERVVTELAGYATQLDAKRKGAEALTVPYDGEKIAALVQFYDTVQKTIGETQGLITKMNEAIGKCQLAMAPLSAARTTQLETLGMLQQTKVQIERAGTDKEALSARVGALQTHMASVAELATIVGKPCLNYLYEKGQVWYMFNSYAGAIPMFKTYWEQQKSTPVPAVSTAAAVSAAAQPAQAATTVQAAPTKAAEPVVTPQPAASAAPAVASKPMTIIAAPSQAASSLTTFDVNKELPILKKLQARIDASAQNANIEMIQGKHPYPSLDRAGLKALVLEVETYLQTHILQAPVAHKEWDAAWRQTSSLVRSLDSTLTALSKADKVDPKHASKK
jgi:hypothetical protein